MDAASTKMRRISCNYYAISERKPTKNSTTIADVHARRPCIPEYHHLNDQRGFKHLGLVFPNLESCVDDGSHLHQSSVNVEDGQPPVQGSRLRLQVSDYRSQAPRFRVQGSGFRVQGSGFRVQGSGLRLHDSGFRVQGSGFRVLDFLSWSASSSNQRVHTTH